MKNQVGVFSPGGIWDSLPTTALGRKGQYADRNYALDMAPTLTGFDNEYIICANNSGSTFTKGTLVKFDTSTPYVMQKCSAVCGAGERADGVVDSFLGTTVADGKFFLLIRKGLCRVTSSTSTSIAVGKALMPAASGKVLEEILGWSPVVFGYAIEAVAASATLFRAYVDFTGPFRAQSSRSVAAGSTLTLTNAAHANKTILLDTVTGSVVTLPAATGSGTRFRFIVSAIATSNSHKVQVANSTDVIQGIIQTMSDDPATMKGFAAAATSDTITLNRSTTGSVNVGEVIEIEDYASGFFMVTGVTSSTGSEATPFTAAV